jgi:hypothetical protein
MLAKFMLALILLAAGSGCGGNRQNYKAYRLASGKIVKVTGVTKTDYPAGGTALVMNYLTDIPLDDKPSLRKEVDEIWAEFQRNVEAAQVFTGVIRATHVDGPGLGGTGLSHDFVFVKGADGGWHYTEDQ